MGGGHPNEFGGPAPLLGVNPSDRTMSSLNLGGSNIPRAPNAKLLVKKEWDLAEEWMNINIPN